MYGMDGINISPMVVALILSNIASYSGEMSESLYVAEVSPFHKITLSEEFNSNLTILSGRLKKSKSKGISNLFSNVFLIAFSWVVTVSAVTSVFFCTHSCF